MKPYDCSSLIDIRATPAKDIVSMTLRSVARDLLAQCSISQIKTFEKAFPKRISIMSDDMLKDAIAVCQRNLSKSELVE